MKSNYKHNKNRRKNSYSTKKKKVILVMIIVAVVVLITPIISLKLLGKNKDVQVLAANNTADNAADLKQQDESDNSKEKNTNDVPEKEASNVDDVADVEKYLNQQSRGQKTDDTSDKKVVYLTFDDGPSETVTPSILNTLKTENVKATFFVLGKSIDQSETNRKLLKQEVEDGHAIGNHTYSHNYKYLYPKGSVNIDNFMSDINKTNESLKKVLGQDFSTRAIRFPGGHMSWKNTTGIDQELQKKDYHYIDWNALSKDAEGAPKNAEQLKQEVIKTVGNKTKVVVLMHDTYGKEETAKALPEIIKYFKDQGYEFRTFK